GRASFGESESQCDQSRADTSETPRQQKGTMSIRAAESILEFAQKGIERGQNKLPIRETPDLDSLITEDQLQRIKDARKMRELALKPSGSDGRDHNKE